MEVIKTTIIGFSARQVAYAIGQRLLEEAVLLECVIDSQSHKSVTLQHCKVIGEM